MADLEVLTVIDAVGAIISAYGKGYWIVSRVKQKRFENNGLLLSMYLEESLDSGPPAIEAERDNGLRVFDQVFGKGDGILAFTPYPRADTDKMIWNSNCNREPPEDSQ